MDLDGKAIFSAFIGAVAALLIVQHLHSRMQRSTGGSRRALPTTHSSPAAVSFGSAVTA
ncbi:MAG TPA: hypothetical protein VGG48_19110 [Rhizomicrobium sp.]